MPDCSHKVTRTDSLQVPGDQATIQLDPPIEHPCSAKFFFVPHGKHADILTYEALLEVDRDVGEVRVNGVSAGHVTITLLQRPTGSIRVEVSCEGKPGCGPTWTTIQLAGFEQNVVVQSTHN